MAKIRIWNTKTRPTTADSYEGHSNCINSVGFSPDGKDIVSGCRDATILVWDAQTGQITLGPLKGHINSVISVRFSRDGKYIVSGSSDRTIRVWDAQTGQITLGPLKGHTDRVQSVGFSPDGRYIVSGSRDHTIRVWNTNKTEAWNEHRLLTMNEGNLDPNQSILENSDWVVEDGWILGQDGELLLWVPPWARGGLAPPMVKVVASARMFKLNLRNFRHGSSWQECWSERRSATTTEEISRAVAT